MWNLRAIIGKDQILRQIAMNRSPRWAVGMVAMANLLLILAFPPYDYVSLQRGNVPTFSGFHFFLDTHVQYRLNSDFLALEVLVTLISAAIGLLLLGGNRPAGSPPITTPQKAVMWLVLINLFAALLFPPFENYLSISKATLPSFEGFYFVFGDNSRRQLVAPLLYLEIALILINGGLLWLLFCGKKKEKLTAEEIRSLARRLQSASK